MASWFPLGFEGGGSMGVRVPDYVRTPNEDMGVQYSIVSPRYFATLQIEVTEGRDFTDRDDSDQPGVAIINQAMARRFWPGQNPVGRKFLFRGGDREATVVGVVRNGKYRSLDEQPKPFMYFPYQQGAWDLNLGVALRTQGDPRTFAETLRREVRRLDPGVEVWALLPMTDFVQAAFLGQRMISTLLAGLGAVALLLAAMGIYGVMAYVVGQRIQEFGVRLALGATTSTVIRLVLNQAFRLTSIGLGVGLLATVGLSRSLSSFLYGVSPFDPLTFLTVAGFLMAVSLGASLVPALRAGTIDPLKALRNE